LLVEDHGLILEKFEFVGVLGVDWVVIVGEL
jgi:hypothetical protein